MWEKSQFAARSAKALVALGDHDGAVNRAYYAIFCAARAGLRFVHPDLDQSKTHAGVIRTFGKEMVQHEGLDPDLGRIIAKLERVRTSADYDDVQLGRATVDEVLDDMDFFLSAIAAFIAKPRT